MGDLYYAASSGDAYIYRGCCVCILYRCVSVDFFDTYRYGLGRVTSVLPLSCVNVIADC